MNVIFLDFDGVIDTVHFKTFEQIEEKIKIIADIANFYDCKIVIEAACKGLIDEETLEYDNDWIDFVFKNLKKYGVEIIGRTPQKEKILSDHSILSMWKEDEIIEYLYNHPEIDHFCVIDDDDLYEISHHQKSDLNMVREYLVKTIDYNRDNYEEEGILPKHKDEVGKVLKLENKFKK